ncbi:MAG: MFS transporter [Chloroflexota bacterium]
MNTQAPQTQQSDNRYIFWFFGLMAVVQGGSASYLLNFLKPHLATQGISVELIAFIAALLFAPLAVKVLFGLMIDRFSFFGYGHRMSYMIFGLGGYGFFTLIAFWVEPNAHFGFFTALMLLGQIGLALSDTAATAYGMEVARLEEHSKVRTIFTVGRGLGFIGVSFVSGYLAKQFGYAAIFMLLAIITYLPFLLLPLLRNTTVHTERPAFNWRALGVMFQPKYLGYIAFLILAFFTFQGIDGLTTYYLSRDLGISEEMLGIFGTMKGIGVIAGAILWHWVSQRWGRNQAVLITIASITVGGLWVSVTTNQNSLLLLSIILGIVTGFQRTAYITYSMGITDLRIAASMLAVFQMVSNIGVVSGEWISTILTETIQFSTLFQWLAVVNLLLIPCFIWLSRQLQRPDATNTTSTSTLATTEPVTS